jgi:hypothetical protein
MQYVPEEEREVSLTKGSCLGSHSCPPASDPSPGTPLVCGEATEDTSQAPNCPAAAPEGNRCYGRADYLFWWVRNQSAPPLLTSGGATNTIVGGQNLTFDNQQRHGGRLLLGGWLDSDQTVGVEVGGFFLAPRDPSVGNGSSGTPTLGRPFINPVNGQADQVLVASPGSSGTSDISAYSLLWSAEANVRVEVCHCTCWHVDCLTGFRYLDLSENLLIDSSTTTAGTTTALSDRFATRNQFYGGQLGVEGEAYWGRFFVNGWGKVALGDIVERAAISGSGGTGGGGLLAQPSNSGTFHRDRFAVLPEAAINFGIKLNYHMRLSIGYTALWLNNVVRPGEQIDPVVNTTGAGPHPAFHFQDSSFWAQGVNAGLEFRY